MIVKGVSQQDHQKLVLIVDDEPRNVALLQAMLTPDGFLFRTAGTGLEALASIAEQRPDLVLLDFMMPGMDGHEVVRRIKADDNTRTIPVIMVTALDDRESRLASLDAGAEEFLTKPVDRAELRVRVRNLLRLKALSDYYDQYSQSLESDVRSRTSDLLESEAALVAERNTAQRYLDTAQVILLALDLDGRITLVNPYACRLLGRDADELIGKTWVEMCLPARMRNDVRHNLQGLISGDPAITAMLGERGTIEGPVTDGTGGECLIEWRPTVVYDSTGAATGTFCSGTDITARTKAVSELRAAEERMRFTLVSANIGTWDFNVVDGTLRWSDTLETQFGMATGTFPGTFAAFMDRVHPDDRERLLSTLSAVSRSGEVFSVEHRVVQEDGGTRWLLASGRYELDDAGNPLRAIGISQDITARRTLERQYQQAQKMEAVGQLASGVAHDFNNLLTVITGFAEFVATSLPEDSQAGDDVAEIIKAADRAAALTQQLLAFSRQQVLHMAPVNLNELITGMSGMMKRLIGANITVTLALNPDLCPAIADRGQLEQVLMNLVVNARDAMPSGGSITIETVDAHLENSPFHDEHVEAGDYVMLAVTDTGMGMSKETQKRLFEPFYTTKKVGEGSGLGLSTSYGIVKQSNGHIWVYSEPGMGTTIKVYLPRSCDPFVPGASPPPQPSPSQITETLLVVEDEGAVLDLTARVLREAGYRVLVAANGADARTLYHRRESVIDLVLTDVVMPGVGGPELVAQLHADNPALKVLYMSGYTEKALAKRMEIDRGGHFLQKPFTSAELLRCVRLALESTPSHAQAGEQQ